MNDQLSLNRQMNASYYSFLDFMNYDKMSKNMKDGKLDGTLKINRDVGAESRNMTLKQLRNLNSRHRGNEIKECS